MSLYLDFNTTLIIDYNYGNDSDTEYQMYRFNHYWMSDFSSVRIISRDRFDNVISNYTRTIPVLRGISITIDVYTIKIVNQYSEVINITLQQYNTTSSSVYGVSLDEQVMPLETISFDLYISTYGITGYINDTGVAAFLDNGTTMALIIVTLSTKDMPFFIDSELALRSFEMIVSDMWGITIVTNKDDKVTPPAINIYLNSSLQGDSPYVPGTMLLTRPAAGVYNLTVYITYLTESLTYYREITIASNALIHNWHVSGLSTASSSVYIIWNTNKGSGTLRVYDNSSLLATTSTEGEYNFEKSSTIGIHLLEFNVTVETLTFTFNANYTVSDWTATVVLAI